MKQDLLSALNWRYATKNFDSSKVLDEETLKVLTESLRLSPSSFGLQPWHFIVIRDPELRATLQGHSWNQSQITEASHIVVHCALKTTTPEDVTRFIQDMAETRSVSVDALSGYQDMILGTIQSRDEAQLKTWAQKQVYISQGFLLEAAALLGVDACPMEGFDPAAYDEVLGLSGSKYTATLVTALGYRSPEDKYADAPKVRFPESEVIEFR